MKPSVHVIASVSIGAVMWFFTKSVYAGILCFLSGIAVDLDHVIEYVIHYGRKGVGFKRIYEACEQTGMRKGNRQFKKLYFVFHINEIALLLWLVTIYTENIYLLAITVGYSSHLILDCVGNELSPRSYFLVRRIIHNFSADRLFRNGRS